MPPTLRVAEVRLGSGSFNPKQPHLQMQILQRIGAHHGATIETLEGTVHGGQQSANVWHIGRDPCLRADGSNHELVLKLVSSSRVAEGFPTQTENFLKLYKDYPTVIEDTNVAFPSNILHCIGRDNVRQHDLIVMRKVEGQKLSEIMARKWAGKQIQQLMDIFQKLGSCLAEFHLRYDNLQHGAFQPSNIFYNDEDERITFIDMGSMGVPEMDSDIQHFTRSLTRLSDAYGRTLLNDGMRHFEQGYAMVRPWPIRM